MSGDVVFTRLSDGSGALLHLPTMAYFDLNPTAIRIWELLQESPEGVGRRLAGEYAITEVEAEAAVAEFLAELREAGLWSG